MGEIDPELFVIADSHLARYGSQAAQDRARVYLYRWDSYGITRCYLPEEEAPEEDVPGRMYISVEWMPIWQSMVQGGWEALAFLVIL